MIKFNPDNKDVLTFGECLGPAMEITDQNEADEYYKAYLEWQKKHMTTPNDSRAEEICKTNLGYYSGYYGLETQKRVQQLFLAVHPIFGPIS